MVVVIGGEIVAGDAERFTAELANARPGNSEGRKIVVELSSPGGSYVGGLLLAIAFRRSGAATVVREGAACYSACALAFLGGSEPLRDVADGSAIPDQPPSRTLEPGGTIGLHAPYLDVPAADYSAANVEGAYRNAVDGISMLVALAEHLYVEPTELPRLLEPGRDSTFLVDTVDAVRSLWIEYPDYRLQFRHLPSITPSMVRNACVNRWYHRQRRSALSGYAVAAKAMRDFEEGSELLENGEAGFGFGTRLVKQGTAASWLTYMPVKMTPDGKSFVWCVFDAGVDSPRVLYRATGTIVELFEPLENGDIWAFASSEGVVNPEGDVGIVNGTLRVFDAVPADTALDAVADVIERYQASETALAP